MFSWLQAFYPKTTYTEESNVSEEILRGLIKKIQVSDAITVYEICQSKGVGT